MPESIQSPASPKKDKSGVTIGFFSPATGSHGDVDIPTVKTTNGNFLTGLITGSGIESWGAQAIVPDRKPGSPDSRAATALIDSNGKVLAVAGGIREGANSIADNFMQKEKWNLKVETIAYADGTIEKLKAPLVIKFVDGKPTDESVKAFEDATKDHVVTPQQSKPADKEPTGYRDGDEAVALRKIIEGAVNLAAFQIPTTELTDKVKGETPFSKDIRDARTV